MLKQFTLAIAGIEKTVDPGMVVEVCTTVGFRKVKMLWNCTTFSDSQKVCK